MKNFFCKDKEDELRQLDSMLWDSIRERKRLEYENRSLKRALNVQWIIFYCIITGLIIAHIIGEILR